MLGNSKDDPATSPVRRVAQAPDRSLHLRITMSDGSGQVSRRLARKIRESISRTLAQEANADCLVSLEGPDGSMAVERGRPNRATHAAPGCGAWWNF